ncbi:MAG: hypothetical protein OEU90_01445 [Gammaproteobacteria bacterium]|nr:hypothetical protein [Gammaproteobacteria bacterium]MDH3750043.1 hypothetical protein [Gammaproteobacteria bacterium]MDH3804112.1 hypothetical protein [Gammaproteobacteria bacterium]
MMRLLGVLVGSALAVAALVVFVGIPQVQTGSRVTPIGDNGVIRLPTPSVSQPVPQDLLEPAQNVVDDFSDEIVEEVVDTAAEQTAAENIDVMEDTQQWYAFWSPFRTEIAATGFVAQLQRVTGLDYRVVKVKTGVYEVAFAYGDDNEIMSNISQISAATGLELPDG